MGNIHLHKQTADDGVISYTLQISNSGITLITTITRGGEIVYEKRTRQSKYNIVDVINDLIE